MDEAQTLHDIACLAVASHDAGQFAAETTARLEKLLDLTSCCLWLPSRDGQRLVQASCAGDGVSRGPLALEQPCAETEVFRNRAPTFTGDPDLLESTTCDLSSYAVFPLRQDGEAAGVLVFARDDDSHFSEEEAEALARISDHVALGVSLVRLREEHARRVELQQTFGDMAKSMLLTSTTPDDVLHNASVLLRTYLGGQATLAAVPEGQWWRIVSATGYPPGLEGRRFHQTVMFGLSAAARERSPLLSNDTSRLSASVSANGRLQSVMVLPLVTPSGVVATIVCGFEERREFGAWESEVAAQFSETVSLGYQNAVLRADEQEALFLGDRLRSIQTRLFSAAEQDAAMEAALAKATELVGGVACSFVTQEQGTWRFQHSADERGMFEVEEVRSEIHELLDIWVDRAGVRAYTSATPALALEDVWIAVAPVPDGSPRAAIVCIRRDGRFSVPRVNFLQNLARIMSLAAIERRVRSDREWLAASRQQWLAGVSHDLRTPLSSIRGYAELLAEPVVVPPEEVQRQARIIADQTCRIQSLVEDMLLTFRIKEGALPVTLEPADLYEVLVRVAEETRADFRLSDPDIVRLEALPDEHLSRVDPRLLERAVQNLVSNAIVHNPPNTHVSLRLSRSAQAEQIAVIDDGVGIDPEQLARLWNRYERGNDTPSSDGIGLGMSVTRQLVEAMGGTIDVTSTPGEGTKFTLAFPPVSSAVSA